MFIRAYLRASTDQQDANRAREVLQAFVANHSHRIASYYVENVSGRKLKRPELMRLLDEAEEGDVLLVEAVDRLTRLTSDEWAQLRRLIEDKGLSVVSVDLPTSHKALFPAGDVDDTTAAIMQAVNTMLLDILATMACKDYEQRRERSAQGVAKAKALGKYKGGHAITVRNEGIKQLLRDGKTYTEIQQLVGAAW